MMSFRNKLLSATLGIVGMVALSAAVSAAPTIIGTPGSGAANNTDNCNAGCIAAAFGVGGITDGTWTLIGQPETFGSGGSGNGLLNAGGSVTLENRAASDRNQFGVRDDDNTSAGALIFDTNVDLPGSVKLFVNPDTDPQFSSFDYEFYFRNASTNDTCGSADDNCSDNLDMAIYRLGSTNTFAFFFDDGGGNNDNDFDDMIVVANFSPASVPEPMTLGLLGAGLLGLGYAARRRRS